MATYKVMFQTVRKGSLPSGTNTTTVQASSAAEAKSKFKASHRDSSTTKYKILGLTQ